MKKGLFFLVIGAVSLFATTNIAEFTKTLKKCEVIRANKVLSCKKGLKLLPDDEIANVTPDVLNYIRITDSNYNLTYENGKLKFVKNNYIPYFKKYAFMSEKGAVRGTSKNIYQKIISDKFFNPKNSLVFDDDKLIFTLNSFFENPKIEIYSKENKIIYTANMKKTKNGYIKVINVKDFGKPGKIYFWKIVDKDGEVEKGSVFVVQDSKSAKKFIFTMMKKIKKPNEIKIFTEVGYFWYAKQLAQKGGK